MSRARCPRLPKEEGQRQRISLLKLVVALNSVTGYALGVLAEQGSGRQGQNLLFYSLSFPFSFPKELFVYLAYNKFYIHPITNSKKTLDRAPSQTTLHLKKKLK